MALTNLQMSQLSQASQFQSRIVASIMKKALAILDDFRINGNLNYTTAQVTRARSIAQGQSLVSYYLDMACSTNIISGNAILVNGIPIDSDQSDAAIDSQAYTTVFQDAV